MSIDLIVEDGSIVPYANSFSDIPTADGYLISLGNEDWVSVDDEKKKSFLIQGCSYLNHMYRWKGTPVSRDQLTAWPRYSVHDFYGIPVRSDYVPVEIVYANILLAAEAQRGPLFNNGPGGQPIRKKKVDVLEVEYFSSRHLSPTFPLIDQMVKGYIRGRSGGGIIEMVLG